MRSFACLALLLLAAPSIAVASKQPAAPNQANLYEQLSEHVAAAYDKERGGFVDRKGVPSEAAVELALHRGTESATSPWRERGLETIGWTRGLLDTAGGGYHHTSASADPSKADFDKRTDSNARRLENLLLAWRVTGEASHRKEAAMVADFLVRVPFDARGGFAAGPFGQGELIPEINGVATHAWLEWAAVTRDPRRRDEALLTLDRMWQERWSDKAGFLRAEPENPPEPRLLDQVEMGRAFVLAAKVAGRDRDLKRAVIIGNLVIETFADPKKGGFHSQAMRRKNGSISASGADSQENARASRFLCELADLTGDQRYRQAAGRAWMRFADDNDKPGLEVAEWALAVRAAVNPDLTEAPPQWEKVATNEPRFERSIRIGKIKHTR